MTSSAPGTGSGTGFRSLNFAVLVPLVISAALIHVVVHLLRIGTSYRALDIGLTPAAIGVLTAAFGLAPMLLAVQIGRMNDSRGEWLSALLGAAATLAVSIGFLFAATSFEMLLVLSCGLGLAQVLQISALQMITTRCSGPGEYDRVLGYFMIAVTVGQMVGPLIVSMITPPGQIYPEDGLFAYAVGAGAGLVAFSAFFALLLPRPQRIAKADRTTLAEVVRTPGLMVIVLAGSLTVTANDLLLIFYPVTAALQGIDAATVGWLLTLRAGGALASRFFYSGLVFRLGRRNLLVWSMAAAAAAIGALSLPLPIWAVAAIMLAAGVGFGLALPAGLSLILNIAPQEARSTALSLRLTAARFGQFAIPLAASGLALISGVGPIFALIGLSLAASAGTVRARIAP